MSARKNAGDATRRIALLSNITIDLLASKLKKYFDVFVPSGFDTWVQYCLDADSELYSEQLDAIVVLLDGTSLLTMSDEGITGKVAQWEDALSTLAGQLPATPLLVSNLDALTYEAITRAEPHGFSTIERCWEKKLWQLVESHTNVYLLDLHSVIAEMGKRSFYSPKMWYLASMPWSKDGLEATEALVNNSLASILARRKKVLVVDLDNTLWGGVVGEDGVEGLKLSQHGLGQQFYDFQRVLLQMKERGVLLAIASKNNFEDARAAFDTHPDMVLSLTDFAALQINWESKAANIASISGELNITASDFVFIDDNPAERAEVSSLCPEVFVPEFPHDTAELPRFAQSLWEEHFCQARVLQEDARKTEAYRAERERTRIKQRSTSLSDYLTKLGMRANFHQMRPEEEERVAQLVGKSNQFNLTTKRYSRAELHSISQNPDAAVIVGTLSDVYGESGLVSVLIALRKDGCVQIDTMLMSCRAMGRRLEELLVNTLAAALPPDTIIEGSYLATEKNSPVRNLFEKLGFSTISKNGDDKTYRLAAGSYSTSAENVYHEVSADIVLDWGMR